MACQLTFSARVRLFLFAQVRAINSYQLYHACNNEKFHIHAEFRMGDIFGAGVLINDASYLLCVRWKCTRKGGWGVASVCVRLCKFIFV